LDVAFDEHYKIIPDYEIALYTNRNDSSNKGNKKKKYRFRDKKKFQNIMSRVCAALSNFDFSSDDSSSLEEDDNVKRKHDDFTGLCFMSKYSRNIFDSDVSDDLSSKGLSLRVVDPENALCNQDKLLCKGFRENKKLNLELEIVFFKLLLFDPCTMIRVPSHVITTI
jgi:hypothetical protein